jgi:hypothetical protein
MAVERHREQLARIGTQLEERLSSGKIRSKARILAQSIFFDTLQVSRFLASKTF